MPVPNALATLLKLQSPSNMNSTGDQYVDRRRSDIMTGEDAYAPSELDQRMVQSQLGDQGMGVSRDMIRESGIQHGREGRIAAEDKLRQLLLPEQMKGEYAVRAAQESGRAQGERLQYSQEQQNNRTNQSQQAIMDRLTLAEGGRNARQEDQQVASAGRQQTAINARPVPAGMQKNVATARDSYGGMMNRGARMLGMNGGADNYSNALEQALNTDPEGFQALQSDLATLRGLPGNTLAERIAATGAQDTLSPDERAWLQLKLGVQ